MASIISRVVDGFLPLGGDPVDSATTSSFGDFDTQALVAYKLHMPTLKRTDEFSAWLRGLRDILAKAKILARIDRLTLGNPGDVAPVGNGVSEMRIHYGPGYRVYFVQRGKDVIVLLCGGDKRSQDSDIAAAKKLAAELED
jgi:putative addiction module killer protein